MTRLIIKYVFAILICIPLYAQTINSIEITGNKYFSESDYLEWIGINPGTPVFENIKDTIANRVIKNLNNNGYFYSMISGIKKATNNDSSISYSIEIYEGEPAYINEINISNANSADSLILIPEVDFLKDEIFNKSEIEMTISNILDEYENIGFPFVKIIINSLVPYQDSTGNFVNINLKLDKGEKVQSIK
jgi:outer membrane protein assembly factor BamA